MTGYRGTVHFAKSDSNAGAAVPADYSFTAADNGVHVFTTGVTIKTLGNQTVTATDTVTGTIAGTSGTVTVTAATATHLSVSAPARATAGSAFNVTVTALVNDVEMALYASKIISYAQGFALMNAMARESGWTINNGAVALMWRGGCIIRSVFLGKIKGAALWWHLLGELLWAVAFMVLARVLFRLGLRRYSAFGG